VLSAPPEPLVAGSDFSRLVVVMSKWLRLWARSTTFLVTSSKFAHVPENTPCINRGGRPFYAGNSQLQNLSSISPKLYLVAEFSERASGRGLVFSVDKSLGYGSRTLPLLNVASFTTVNAFFFCDFKARKSRRRQRLGRLSGHAGSDAGIVGFYSMLGPRRLFLRSHKAGLHHFYVK
jgi:hypothetical protein